MWIWWLDRGAALASYAVLWLALLTGILHNARAFGPLQRAARTLHVPASVVASAILLIHVAAGAIDTWLVLASRVPHPRYSDASFVAGIVVGAAALLLVVTSILGFVDARRFERPWDPRAVHAFAYGGFAFATVHAAAVGTDTATLALPFLVAATALLLYVLVLRFASESLSNRPRFPKGGRRGDP